MGKELAKPNAKPPATLSGMKSGEIKDMLSLYKGQIAQCLPKHLTAERIIQLTVTLIARTPKLASCTKESIIGAIMQCSMLGLEPIPILGEAYIIPYQNKSGKMEAEFQLGYKGIVALARNTDKVMDIYAENVFSNDFFKITYGLHRDIQHTPADGERGALIGSYAVVQYVNGGIDFEYLRIDEILKRKNRSTAKNSEFSPWNKVDDFPAMCKKTAIRALGNRLPKQVQKSISTDGAVIKIDSFEDGGELNLNKIEPEDSFNNVIDYRELTIQLSQKSPDIFRDCIDQFKLSSAAELDKKDDRFIQEFYETFNAKVQVNKAVK